MISCVKIGRYSEKYNFNIESKCKYHVVIFQELMIKDVMRLDFMDSR